MSMLINSQITCIPKQTNLHDVWTSHAIPLTSASINTMNLTTKKLTKLISNFVTQLRVVHHLKSLAH